MVSSLGNHVRKISGIAMIVRLVRILMFFFFFLSNTELKFS